MYLFFDTETTRLPKNYNAPVTDFDNWPKIIQIAYALFDENGNLLDSRSDLIKPDGWEVPSIAMFMKQGMDEEKAKKEAKFWIDNGYTQEQSLAEGIPIATALFHFIQAIEKCTHLIAHNMSYDEKIAGSEMVRIGMAPKNKPKKFCTKVASTGICKIPHTNGRGYKWPTLTELHKYLFQCGFDGAHDAMHDVNACAKCFFELKKANLIII